MDVTSQSKSRLWHRVGPVVGGKMRRHMLEVRLRLREAGWPKPDATAEGWRAAVYEHFGRDEAELYEELATDECPWMLKAEETAAWVAFCCLCRYVACVDPLLVADAHGEGVPQCYGLPQGAEHDSDGVWWDVGAVNDAVAEAFGGEDARRRALDSAEVMLARVAATNDRAPEDFRGLRALVGILRGHLPRLAPRPLDHERGTTRSKAWAECSAPFGGRDPREPLETA